MRRIVVIGNGMVGHKFCDRIASLGVTKQYHVTVIGEEPRPAYDRVNLTAFFQGKTADDLSLASSSWYEEHGIELRTGVRVESIDRQAHLLRLSDGQSLPYDALVLATGSAPFVPEIPGLPKHGVFVYRTIEDLEAIREYAAKARSVSVIGGGLLGLEAAKAMLDLNLETSVVEFAPRLMPRQLNEQASSVLQRHLETLGLRILLNRRIHSVEGNGSVTGLRLADEDVLGSDMIIVSAGIRPRDELARDCGLAVGQRGGVVVDDELRTSDPDVYAIGEVALHKGVIYGLVAPGYQMADALASTLAGTPKTFTGSDFSTKLKILGVDVANFGVSEANPAHSRTVEVMDTVKGVYKQVILDLDGKRVLGGILVGDTTAYAQCVHLFRSGDALSAPHDELLFGKRDGAGGSTVGTLPDAAQVCSCNNVTKGEICSAICQNGFTQIGQIKSSTKAGTGCGGCLPVVESLLAAELKKAGKSEKKTLCEHFSYSRQELFEIVKVMKHRTFEELLASHGRGHGCELCKPTVASILASLWNEPILKHETLQDTNDRFLANIQRGGTYSVVPRIPGGEITPEKLIVLGQVAQKYGLYCKITGGQRIDLLGARVNELPAIWAELVSAGFESGHAYGKAVRTVKSCVGSVWCRFGVQDSTALAIQIEERYKGIRAPHKIKMAVSGCVRECAEARGKDVGLIATEKGWNLYVCGNGGATPRHAELLVADISGEDAVKYVDRFLMYYIASADKLMRTSTWLNQLEGGIEQLRKVVLEDSLGICGALEAEMASLVGSYACEWTEVVNDPVRQLRFRSFINSDAPDQSVQFSMERGQQRPVVASPLPARPATDEEQQSDRTWVKVGHVDDFPLDGGACVVHGAVQLAVYHFAARGEWFATQNVCPHKQEAVLSRGIIGDAAGEPKVACPMHKKAFSLRSGKCLTDAEYEIATFPVERRGDDILVLLPPPEVLAEAIVCTAKCELACATV